MTPFAGLPTYNVLNQMGQEGWELVSAFPKSFPSNEEFGGYTTEIEYIFKKRVAE